ncbi:MAG TPA: hypothetical protein VHZ54_11710 [Solirubrobacterales bacterium]|jgi:hypothetical protein|nr:hypothetical protein [Solirubrobacterales bacterium]
MVDALFNWLIAAPAIPNDVGGKYVAGAYLVFVVLLLVYVTIMGMKLARIERGLREVAEIAEERQDQAAHGRGSEEPSISDSLAPHGSGGSGS